MVRKKIIDLLLLREGVESNPGPEHNREVNLTISTYNCNGLGNRDKLRRTLAKSNMEIS